jgi:hypothetical protein
MKDDSYRMLSPPLEGDHHVIMTDAMTQARAKRKGPASEGKEERVVEQDTTTWFERKPDFFEHFKRPKFFILGKFCTHPPGGQGSRAHLIWAIISFPNLFLAMN